MLAVVLHTQVSCFSDILGLLPSTSIDIFCIGMYSRHQRRLHHLERQPNRVSVDARRLTVRRLRNRWACNSKRELDESWEQASVSQTYRLL